MSFHPDNFRVQTVGPDGEICTTCGRPLNPPVTVEESSGNAPDPGEAPVAYGSTDSPVAESGEPGVLGESDVEAAGDAETVDGADAESDEIVAENVIDRADDHVVEVAGDVEADRRSEE